MIRQDEWIFPFLYVLLPNKTPYIYERFFTILRDLLPHLHVSRHHVAIASSSLHHLNSQLLYPLILILTPSDRSQKRFQTLKQLATSSILLKLSNVNGCHRHQINIDVIAKTLNSRFYAKRSRLSRLYLCHEFIALSVI